MENNYFEKCNLILKKNLSEKTFELWKGIQERISNKCWEKPTSSTGKYHQKEDGRVPSVIEHTYEMLYAADKLISMFDGVINTQVIFLSIALHDSYKYGLVKSCQSTESRHDSIIADSIALNRKVYLQAMSYQDTVLLEKAVRYHAGKWSTDIGHDHLYDKLTPEVLFLHTLDMMSSKNLIKIKD